jgi:hypothetical protein
MLGERVCWEWFGIRNKVKPIMLLTRFRGLLMAGLLLTGASHVHAQHEQRVNPPGVSGDHQDMFFDHADLSEYGTANKAKTGYFFQYERTMWAFTGPKDTTIGNPNAGGIITNTIITQPPFGQPTATTVSFLNDSTVDTGFIETNYVQGNRYEFGYIDDDSKNGWMASIVHVHNQHQAINVQNATVAFGDPFLLNSQFVDFNNDGIQDDINNNGIFGNNSPFNFDALPFPISDGVLDTYLGPDFGDLLSLPVSFGTLFSINFTKFSSYELMRVIRWDPLHSGGTMEWLYGIRYTQISDDFLVTGINGTGILTSMNINSSLRNHLVGPQVGLRWNKQTGSWRWGAEGRFMAAENFQQIQVKSAFTGANTQLQSGTIVGGNDDQNDMTWAPLGELRLDLAYQMTNAISLRIGYTGLVAGGVTRASRRVDYELPRALVLDGNKSEAFIVNGFNIGVEINR